MQTLNLKLNPRAFGAMSIGVKRVDIRAKPDGSDIYGSIVSGDCIIFTNTENLKRMKVTVIRVTHYLSVRDLLSNENISQTLSSTTDIDKGILSVESIGNYKELIARNGVYAIEIGEPIILNN